jgi:hypothetical protein
MSEFDGVRVEFADGVPRDGIRVIKPGFTSA